MHWDIDDSAQYGEDAVMGVHTFFELDILVPEGMGKEVEPDAYCTSLEEPDCVGLVLCNSLTRVQEEREGRKYGVRWMYVR